MKVIAEPWVVYFDEFAISKRNNKDKIGKWIVHFNNRKQIEQVCQEAVEFGIIEEAKHTNADDGVACFYLECDDIETHKSIIAFLLDNNCLPKTKTGRLCNIAYKLDSQTYAGEYGKKFKSHINLEQFLDLDTCEFWDDID